MTNLCSVTRCQMAKVEQDEVCRMHLPRASVNKPAHGRSERLSVQARDRDHSHPGSPSTTLSPWNPGKRSEASEPIEARR